MAMAPTVKVVLGSIALAVFWVLAVFPAAPLCPLEEQQGHYLASCFHGKAKDLKTCYVESVYFLQFQARFFTNDTSCVVLTEFVLKIAKQQNLPPHPFLLALASSANIGSATTPIGNPQNLVIAVQSKIPFGKFLFGIKFGS
ncbi:hypothetical protein R6Q57_021295 [Mikania cordata]